MQIPNLRFAICLAMNRRHDVHRTCAMEQHATTRGRLAAVMLVVIAAGCNRPESVRAPSNVLPLPVLQPKSGGEMIWIPAGTFTMGDSTGRPDETPHSVSVRSF